MGSGVGQLAAHLPEGCRETVSLPHTACQTRPFPAHEFESHTAPEGTRWFFTQTQLLMYKEKNAHG